jgi:4-amino-4-deoxy-L-arabinose transferase-like glycosyltransferase
MPVLEQPATLDYSTAGTAPAGNRLLTLIPRLRWVFFITVACFLVASFNGRWRVGRDSAAYRGLGHQLATTGKYVFRDKQDVATYSDQQDTRYPGMPLMLAGIEKLFGRGDAPPILAICLIAIATLGVSYFMARAALPAWLAVAVVFGMGVNGRFLTHAHEILSDVPFLLGVVLSLYAFDRFQHARENRPRVVAGLLLVLGLLLCAAMRPTFWVVALALVATCVWGLFRPIHPDPAGLDDARDARARRIACGLTLGLLALAAIVFLAFVDLRGRGAAGYEGKLLGRLADFEQKVLVQLPRNVHDVLEETLPEAFFGTQLGPGFIPVGGKSRIGFSTVGSLLVIGAGVWLVRRNVLWGMLVLVTVGTMAAIGSVPRYFIMILPLLLAGWGLHVAWVSERFRSPVARELVVFAGLGLVVTPNLLSSLNLVREQRGLSRPQQGLKPVGFLKAYHAGKWAGVHDVAKMVRDNVRPEQQVIGPEATVLTFLSDRDVFGLGMLLPRKDRGGIWERKIRGMKSKFAYAVFPDTTDKLYDDKDVVTGKLIRLGLLRPTRTVATAGGYKLSEYEVVPPAPSRKSTRGQRDPIAATQPKRRRGAATTVAAATAPATQTLERPRGRRGRARGATTAPATSIVTTQPAAAPSSRSARARRRAAAAAAAAATQPTTRPITQPSAPAQR